MDEQIVFYVLWRLVNDVIAARDLLRQIEVQRAAGVRRSQGGSKGAGNGPRYAKSNPRTFCTGYAGWRIVCFSIDWAGSKGCSRIFPSLSYSQPW